MPTGWAQRMITNEDKSLEIKPGYPRTIEERLEFEAWKLAGLEDELSEIKSAVIMLLEEISKRRE